MLVASHSIVIFLPILGHMHLSLLGVITRSCISLINHCFKIQFHQRYIRAPHQPILSTHSYPRHTHGPTIRPHVPPRHVIPHPPTHPRGLSLARTTPSKRVAAFSPARHPRDPLLRRTRCVAPPSVLHPPHLLCLASPPTSPPRLPTRRVPIY
jgi:hypothetical protein